MLLLIAHWGFVVEGGVPTMRVVPPLDEFEDGEAGLDLGGEAPPVEEFALERREEALAEGIDAPIDVKPPGGRLRSPRGGGPGAERPPVRRSA